MTEPLDLDALAALEAAATPGPWECGVHGMDECRIDATGPEPMTIYDEGGHGPADAALIAAARNALPALIERVRQAEAEVERLDRALNDITSTALRDRAAAEVEALRAEVERLTESLDYANQGKAELEAEVEALREQINTRARQESGRGLCTTHWFGEREDEDLGAHGCWKCHEARGRADRDAYRAALREQSRRLVGTRRELRKVEVDRAIWRTNAGMWHDEFYRDRARIDAVRAEIEMELEGADGGYTDGLQSALNIIDRHRAALDGDA